jgi:hypothetical protein
MIILQSLLPPQAPHGAFGRLVKDEFRLAWRTPTGLILGLGLPLLLLVIFGSLPAFHQSKKALGGLTFFDVYVPVLIARDMGTSGRPIIPRAAITSGGMAEPVQEGSMPPWYDTLLHPTARLSLVET